MPYSAELDALDRKAGKLHTFEDWRRLSDKVDADITDDDLLIIASFGGPKAADERRARRTKALTPPQPECLPPVTKRAKPWYRRVEFPKHLWDDTAENPIKAIKEWSETNALKAVPIGLWQGFLEAARENRQALEAKVDAYDARLKQLEHPSAGDREQEVETLRRELDELKANTLRDGGVWKSDGALYMKGTVVTYQGSMWVCQKNHAKLGPFDHACWRLLVKSGRSGRDAR